MTKEELNISLMEAAKASNEKEYLRIREELNLIYESEGVITRKKWNELHSVCPLCGSNRIRSTLAGSANIMGEDYRDDINRADCLACGWRGMVNELTPKTNEEESNIDCCG